MVVPKWIRGKRAAQITANMVIASAERLMLFLHFCLKRRSIAEIKVPACPIPIHHTKVVISKAQPTVLFSPQVPIPCQTVQKIMYNSKHHSQPGYGHPQIPVLTGFIHHRVKDVAGNALVSVLPFYQGSPQGRLKHINQNWYLQNFVLYFGQIIN